MFSRIEDFRQSWREECEDTLKVLEAIPDQSLNRSVAPGFRDLRRLGWHLAASIVELPAQLGLKVQGLPLSAEGRMAEPAPATMAEIRAAYRRVTESVLEQVEGWDDAELQKEDTMFGYLRWKRGQSLMALVVHQVHHRGQMTVLMRQAGLRVPGIYGPVKEEWAAMGMEPPLV